MKNNLKGFCEEVASAIVDVTVSLVSSEVEFRRPSKLGTFPKKNIVVSPFTEKA